MNKGSVRFIPTRVGQTDCSRRLQAIHDLFIPTRVGQTP